MTSEDSMSGIRRKHSDDGDYYVYAYEDDDGIVRYIGKGRRNRINSHRLPANKDTNRLARAIATGQAFMSYKVFDGLSNEEAMKAERELIAFYRLERDGGVLWNQTIGGQGAAGRVLSAEVREKIASSLRGRKGRPRTQEEIEKTSAAQRGKKRGPRSPEAIEKGAAAHRGRKNTLETKLKMSKARKGIRLSEETKKKISEIQRGKIVPRAYIENMLAANKRAVVCVNTNEQFESIREAAATKKVSVSNLSAVLNGHKTSVRGLSFEFARAA